MQTDNFIKRIKVRLFEGIREGTTLIQTSPKNFKELANLICSFLEKNNYDPSLYSLYYYDGEDSVHLQNQLDFESALDDCSKTLILEIKRKTEEEMLSHSLVVSPLLKYKQSTNIKKVFSFQEEITNKLLYAQSQVFINKSELEYQVDEQEQNLINQVIQKQLPMLYIQNDKFEEYVDEIMSINSSYFEKLHLEQ